MRAPVEEVIAFFTEHPDMVRGEFIIVVLPAQTKNRTSDGDAAVQ